MKNSLKVSCAILLALFSVNSNANLLLNPGFESGLIYWENTEVAAIRSNNDPVPYEGNNYLFGFDTALFRVWQVIDLISTDFLSSEIDSGQFLVEFGGWQSDWHTQPDFGQIHVRFFDTNPDITPPEIGSTSLPEFYSNNTWEQQSDITNLLAGTRFIRYEFVGKRDGGLK